LDESGSQLELFLNLSLLYFLPHKASFLMHTGGAPLT
jgi:hypothetical protein